MPPAGSGLPRAGDFSLAVARSDAAASRYRYALTRLEQELSAEVSP
jgi:hypothetical protein